MLAQCVRNVVGSCVYYPRRALRARRFTTTCWTVVALWLLLLLSELRVINQVCAGRGLGRE